MSTITMPVLNTKPRDRQTLNNCFVQNPSYWVVLFPDCVRPVVIDHAPPKAWGKLVGSCHTERTGERILKLWDQKIERRRRRFVHAMYTAAGGFLLLAVMVGMQ